MAKSQVERDNAFRERQKKRGLVQVRYWIPECQRENIDKYIERKRNLYVDKAA